MSLMGNNVGGSSELVLQNDGMRKSGHIRMELIEFIAALISLATTA